MSKNALAREAASRLLGNEGATTAPLSRRHGTRAETVLNSAVQLWGNSLAVRFPAKMAHRVHIVAGMPKNLFAQ